MTFEDDLARSKVLGDRVRERRDMKVRDIIVNFTAPLDYTAKHDLMISQEAWKHVIGSNTAPREVFAHPDLLQKHPEASLYYRGIALLSLKRVSQGVGDVKSWETRSRTRPVSRERAIAVCRLYNSAISSIIEGTTQWTMENGYRNILVNMGITLDGMFRNVIGRDTEDLIKAKITVWLESRDLIHRRNLKSFVLPNDITMVYGSEPDILFMRGENQLATIEIKGGKDPAGALERLGAMQKSFTETPVHCKNFLIAGVVTSEMEARLAQMVVDVYILDDLRRDNVWKKFTEELFHYTLRIA